MLKTTVVIPLYNKAEYVVRALDSVFRQTVSEYEVIVVDDGSTDGGAELVETCCDLRVKLVSQTNGGAAAARNRGVELAATELVAFLDADDEWHPDFLATVLDLRERFPEAGLYATAFELLESSGNRTRPDFRHVPTGEGGLIDNFFRCLPSYPPVSSSAVMVPKEIYIEAGSSPVDVLYGEDVDTWMRIALRYPVAWSPKACATYHMDADHRACHKLWVGDVPFAKSYEEYASEHPVAEDVREAVEEYLASNRLTHLIPNAALAGRRRLARELLCKTKSRRGSTVRWRLWRLATYLPHPVLLPAWKLWHRLAGRKVELGLVADIVREPSRADRAVGYDQQ